MTNGLKFESSTMNNANKERDRKKDFVFLDSVLVHGTEVVFVSLLLLVLNIDLHAEAETNIFHLIYKIY